MYIYIYIYISHTYHILHTSHTTFFKECVQATHIYMNIFLQHTYVYVRTYIHHTCKSLCLSKYVLHTCMF